MIARSTLSLVAHRHGVGLRRCLNTGKNSSLGSVTSSNSQSSSTVDEGGPSNRIQGWKNANAPWICLSGGGSDHNGGTGTTKTRQKQPNDPLAVPRRLTVKRSNQSPRNRNKEPEVKHEQRSKPKLRKWKKPLITRPFKINDRQEQTILTIPRRQSLDTKLPILNAGAFLDSRDYIFKTGKKHSTSGTAAARRLLNGRRDLLREITNFIDIQKKFALTGHGIPPQFLQENINLAHDVLSHYENASSCSFHTRSDIVESMAVRHRNGVNVKVSWPPEIPRDNYSWDDSLMLYLKAMERMARHLEDFLKAFGGTHPRNVAPRMVDDYRNEFDTSSTNAQVYLHYWNVVFARLEDREHNDGHQLSVEWTLSRNERGPGSIRFELAGFPEFRGKGSVVLTYNASFRWYKDDRDEVSSP